MGPYGSRHAHNHSLLLDILGEQNVGLSKKDRLILHFLLDILNEQNVGLSKKDGFLNIFVPRRETQLALV
jgi:hypothetical protein